MSANTLSSLSASEIDEIAARNPGIFAPSPWRRLRPVLIVAAAIVYALYCWWFFAIGKVLGDANWDIAGNYLADWISYEVRPDFEIAADGAIELSFPRFSPLGANPDPDWIAVKKTMMMRGGEAEKTVAADKPSEKAAGFGFMVPDAKGTSTGGTQVQTGSSFGFMVPDAQGTSTGGGDTPEAADAPEPRRVEEEVIASATVTMGSDRRLEIAPGHVRVQRGGETLVLRLDHANERVEAEGSLPDWASQKLDGGKVIAYLGFAGRVEVRHDDVKVRHRFLGWENFVFDANSPFWGKSLGEVASLVVSGERLDPDRSNLALAWNNILYNADWQHLDVWTKLLQTIVMAFVGTLFAAIIAFPLAFIAARNITRSRFMNQVIKRFFDFQRSVDMFIWALFFTRAFGPGPLAGISAIFFTDTGTLGKLYSEALENIDDKQREGVKSVGASPMAVQRYGVLPQVMPLFASQALYFWESNTRSATIIGAVGAGGIGLKLWEAMRTNQDWENVAYMVLLILLVVFIFDNISNALRSRLMGKTKA